MGQRTREQAGGPQQPVVVASGHHQPAGALGDHGGHDALPGRGRDNGEVGQRAPGLGQCASADQDGNSVLLRAPSEGQVQCHRLEAQPGGDLRRRGQLGAGRVGG